MARKKIELPDDAASTTIYFAGGGGVIDKADKIAEQHGFSRNFVLARILENEIDGYLEDPARLLRGQ